MELRRFAVTAADGRSWSLEIPCPPLLQDVRAIGGAEAITLVWDRLDTSAAPWVSGPTVVVSRIDADAILAAKTPKTGLLLRLEFTEVGRVAPTACRYRDQTVEPGRTYVYRLAVEGEVEAVVSDPATGDPQRVTRRVRGVALVHNKVHGVVATAEPAKPLRLALVTPRNRGADDRAAVAMQMLRNRLPSLPWVMLTERDTPQDVAEEKVVSSMGQDEQGVAASELAPAEAGLLVEVPPFLGDELQVWLEDYLNGRHRLLARAPLSQPGDLAARVLEGLAQAFPERVKARVADDTAPSQRPRLAVLAFRPGSSASAVELSRGAFREMLAAELAGSSRFVLVDREWTDALFAEQERLALQGEEGTNELGRVLGAEYLLTGTYRLHHGELVVEACLVEVAHGTRSNLVVCRGTLDELGALARRLEKGLQLPRPFAEIASAIPLAFAFDLDDSLRGADYRLRIDVATLARSRKPSDVLLAAKNLRARNPKLARRLLEQLLARDIGQAPDLLPQIVTILDAVLFELGETQRRVELWRGIAANPPPGRQGQRLKPASRLAEALLAAGKVDKARELVRKDPGEIDDVALLTSLGLHTEALEASLAENWFRRKTFASAYGGAVFLLRNCGQDPEIRRVLLVEIARRLAGTYPRQVRHALEELEGDGGLPDGLAGVALANAVRLGDGARMERALQQLPRLPALDQIMALGRCLAFAGRHGDKPLAERMLAAIGKVKPDSPRARHMHEIRLARGLPKIEAQEPPASLSDEALLRSLGSFSGSGQKLDDTSFMVTQDEVLVAFDPRRRRVLWRLDLEPQVRQEHASISALSNTIWASEDTVYAPACQDGRLLAVDAKTGRVKWSYTAWGRISPPVVTPDGQRVILGELGFGFLVLDASTGALVKALTTMPDETYWGSVQHVGLRELRQLDTSYKPTVSPWVVQTQGSSLWTSARGPHSRGQRAYGGATWRARSLNLETWRAIAGMPPPVESKVVLLSKLTDKGVPEAERRARIGGALRDLPRNVAMPTLLCIVKSSDEPLRVRETALRSLLAYEPDEAIEAVVEILEEPQSAATEQLAVMLTLSDTAAAKLRDESVQMLAALLKQPSVRVRARAAVALVQAMGPGAREKVVPLVPQIQQELQGGWRRSWSQDMGLAMAKRGMPESLALLAPRIKPSGYMVGDPYYLRVLELARSGCAEARQHVSLPFDPDRQLALLRQAKPPLKHVQCWELAKPYKWIRTYYPSPELRAEIAETRVRVVGEEALLPLIREDFRRHGVGYIGKMARPVTGLDLGDDSMAWEQAVRYRRSK
jgi:TolB-like protein